MKKVLFTVALFATSVLSAGTVSAETSVARTNAPTASVQIGFARIAPSDLPQAVKDALGKQYPGSFVEEAYNDAGAGLYKVLVKKSDGWAAKVLLDKEGFIKEASETPAA